MKIEKQYINNFIDRLWNSRATPEADPVITTACVDVAIMLMECRASYVLDREEGYSDLYIDPKVDIVNSNPQVIQQVKEELYEFLCLLSKNNVRSILQIGLGHFASTHFVLSLLMDSICTIEYDDLHIKRYYDEINLDKETLICGDSTSQEVIQQAKNLGPFDCVFIDGNHSYEYVKLDLENYTPLVKQGGIVSLHDANFEGERYGTPRVIREATHDWKKISHSDEVGIAYFIRI